jgi:hypothetical protein
MHDELRRVTLGGRRWSSLANSRDARELVAKGVRELVEFQSQTDKLGH